LNYTIKNVSKKKGMKERKRKTNEFIKVLKNTYFLPKNHLNEVNKTLT
jgi:hypothetical protein